MKKLLQRVGLALFAIGFIAFIGSLFTSTYTLSNEIIINSASNSEQSAVLQKILAKLVDQEYSSKWD